MAIRKEIHLESNVLKLLESEALRQKRSLKNYLEYVVIQESKRLEVPSEKYRNMMDDKIEKFKNGELNFSNINDFLERNGISN